tara:strand:+ start:52 stop:231 length:180 start_codon:yes stop_codon:yes gene_type:complete
VKYNKLVRIKTKEKTFQGKIGIVLDSMEMNSGYIWYEVMFDNERHWFDEINLEVIDEGR